MLAPIVVVCARRLHARGLPVAADQRFVAALVPGDRRLSGVRPRLLVSLWLGRAVLVDGAAVRGAGGACHRPLSLPRAATPWRRLFLSPLMIPHVVLGIAFLRFFTAIGIGGTFDGLLLAHIVVVMPFALRLTLAAAIGMDRSIEMAAISLGAGGWTVFRRVTLPLILPGVVSGWVLAFIQSSTR